MSDLENGYDKPNETNCFRVKIEESGVGGGALVKGGGGGGGRGRFTGNLLV